MDLFSETLLGIPWTLLAIAALIVAVVFAVIDTSGTSEGWRWFVLRWGHSLCWVFLGAAALAMTRVTLMPVEWAGRLAALGGLLYLAFFVTMATGRG